MNDIVKMTIDFDLPTHWLHGAGYAKKTGELLKERNVKAPLVLTDGLLVKLGTVKPVLVALDACGYAYDICDKFTAEPTVRHFDATIKELDLKRYDAVVAVGGGSVLDSAKALAVIAKFGGSVRDFAGRDKIPAAPDWVNISIPTTAGTGSEVSDGGVFIDEDRNSKFIMMSKKVSATVALTDPLMTVSMPPKVTAVSGSDALVHAVESYLSRYANPVSRLFSSRAIELISRYLPKAYADGQDLEARNAMQIGSTMAMSAGCNVYLGLCHSIAMPLCGLYHMPHGQACGMCLPFVLKYNAATVPQHVKEVLVLMGMWDETLPEAEAFANGFALVEQFLNAIGIGTHLSPFGFKPNDVDAIAASTLNSLQCPPNPRTPTHGEIAELVASFA